MKEQVKKYLLCGGTLLCLGAVSAGLLSGVNLLTAPIIDAASIPTWKDTSHTGRSNSAARFSQRMFLPVAFGPDSSRFRPLRSAAIAASQISLP